MGTQEPFFMLTTGILRQNGKVWDFAITTMHRSNILVTDVMLNIRALITCPEQLQDLSKSTYSPSLLYIPMASLVAFPSSSSINFSWAMLSNNLDKWRHTCFG